MGIKILNFDNSRCVNFLNTNRDFLNTLFWQELAYLAASFWVNGFKKCTQKRMDESGKSYKGNIKESVKLIQDSRKEFDSLSDMMIGQMAMEDRKDEG